MRERERGGVVLCCVVWCGVVLYGGEASNGTIVRRPRPQL